MRDPASLLLRSVDPFRHILIDDVACREGDLLKRLLPLFCSLLLLAACHRSAPRRVNTNDSWSDSPVVLISIDTLRADRLSIYGSKEVKTPSFETLAHDSVVYDNAYSHCPLTLPSHLSVFSGLLPAEHGVRDNIGFHFDSAKHPTVASLLHAKGYAAGAAVSAYVLKRDSGVSAGFDDYDDAIPVIPGATMSNLYRKGADTIEIANRWIAQQKSGKWFYFLHLYEPHAPYDPPEPYKSQYAQPYDGEVAYSDALLGAFLDHLKKSGIYDRATIIVFSDHGEGLLDHGEQEHGILLYREDIHVPLLVKLPKSQGGGTRVTRAVELRDIAPTLLAVSAVQSKELPKERSLLAAVDAVDSEHAVFSETMYPRIHLGWSDLRSLTTSTHHYIEARTPEVYDLKSDPTERTNVLQQQRRVYVRLREQMASFPREAATPSSVDPEEAAKLAALGYISATKPTAATDLPDPKDKIGEIEKLKAAFKLAAENRYADAISALKILVADNPTWTDAWTKLATCYELSGDLDQAIATYKKAITVAPTLASEYALSLASLQLKTGAFDEAAKHAELALRDNPGGAHQVLGEIALARNDLPAAEKEAQVTIRSPQFRLQGELLAAQIASARGDFQGALRLVDQLQRDADANHRLPFAYLEFVRADALAKLEHYPEAVAAFQREVEAFPHNRQAYANLALIYLIQQQPQPAYAALESMAAANPDKHTFLFAAKTLETLGDTRGAQSWKQRAESVH